VHSGDSACVIPTQGISPEALATIREWTPKLAKDLRVIGLINIQYCVQDNQASPICAASAECYAAHGASPGCHCPRLLLAILNLCWCTPGHFTAARSRQDEPVSIILLQVYIIEANPRASRTVPFVAKAVGHPIVKYASLLMAGKTLAEIGFTEEPKLNHVAVKEAVLPFDKFPGAVLVCLSSC
jgi:carbamoyl-phosphate synthase large subunit